MADENTALLERIANAVEHLAMRQHFVPAAPSDPVAAAPAEPSDPATALPVADSGQTDAANTATEAATKSASE